MRLLPHQLSEGMSLHYMGSRLYSYLRLDAHILCDIESDLSTADEAKFKHKNRRFWNPGKHYYEINYQIKVLIGPADIRFELCKLRLDQASTQRGFFLLLLLTLFLSQNRFQRPKAQQG